MKHALVLLAAASLFGAAMVCGAGGATAAGAAPGSVKARPQDLSEQAATIHAAGDLDLAGHPGAAVPGIAEKANSWRGGALDGGLVAGSEAGSAASGLRRLEPEPIIDLIWHFYREALGRDPEAGAVDAWKSGYFDYAMAFDIDVRFIGREMGRQFFLSAEYAARDRTDSEFLSDCYRTFLYREPSQTELDAWLAGVWSRSEAMTIFAESDEFGGVIEGLYPGRTGDPTRNFVTVMYIGVLDRLVDGAGLVAWADEVDNYPTERLGKARYLIGQLITSAEYLSKSPTDADLVVNLYRAFMGRFPNDGEVAYWSDELGSGRQSLDKVMDFFTIAPEFSEVLNGYFVMLVPVPGGTFTMGATDSGDDATYRTARELPRHDVTLSPYWIGKYEVTNRQVCRVYAWALANGRLANSSGGSYDGGEVYLNGRPLLGIPSPDCQVLYSGGTFTWKNRDGWSMADHPCGVISWFGAVAFCNWLSEMEGLQPCYDLSSWTMDRTRTGYRLPTEAEWERAAGWDGSRHWVYGFTSDELIGAARCNYHQAEGGNVNPLGLTSFPFTSPVGWFNGNNVSPNGAVQTIDSQSPVGAYDMSGNVYEWCHDWLAENWYEGGAMTDPTGPAAGDRRVIRGNDWDGWRPCGRSANRDCFDPEGIYSNFGFRVARTQ